MTFKATDSHKCYYTKKRSIMTSNTHEKKSGKKNKIDMNYVNSGYELQKISSRSTSIASSQ